MTTHVCEGGVYVKSCPRCCARFCLTLPKESAKATAEKWCREEGLDIAEVRRIAAELKEDRIKEFMR